jgi:hypothetical protein
VKNHINVVQRRRYCRTVTNVSFDKFCDLRDPSRIAVPVCLRLEVVEYADLPTFPQQEVGDMGAD